MKAIATRGRSYGKFFVGACWSREGWSFGFQVLEVVWASYRVAFGDMPGLRGGKGGRWGALGGTSKAAGRMPALLLERGGIGGATSRRPRLTRGVVWNGGTAQTELGPPMGGKRDGDYPKRSSGDGKAFRYRNDLLKRALAGLAGILLPPKEVKCPQTKSDHGVGAGFGNGVHVEAIIGVTALCEDLSRRGAEN